MKDDDRNTLLSFKDVPCCFCGNNDDTTDYVLFGTEAHKKNPHTKIVKICCNCENDWISTYRR